MHKAPGAQLLTFSLKFAKRKKKKSTCKLFLSNFLLIVIVNTQTSQFYFLLQQENSFYFFCFYFFPEETSDPQVLWDLQMKENKTPYKGSSQSCCDHELTKAHCKLCSSRSPRARCHSPQRGQMFWYCTSPGHTLSRSAPRKAWQQFQTSSPVSSQEKLQ